MFLKERFLFFDSVVFKSGSAGRWIPFVLEPGAEIKTLW
jgi:hypothetical protein